MKIHTASGPTITLFDVPQPRPPMGDDELRHKVHAIWQLMDEFTDLEMLFVKAALRSGLCRFKGEEFPLYEEGEFMDPEILARFQALKPYPGTEPDNARCDEQLIPMVREVRTRMDAFTDEEMALVRPAIMDGLIRNENVANSRHAREFHEAFEREQAPSVQPIE